VEAQEMLKRQKAGKRKNATIFLAIIYPPVEDQG
jgi:hypothetical protein